MSCFTRQWQRCTYIFPRLNQGLYLLEVLQLACAAGAGFALLDSDPPKLNYLSTPISKEDSLHIRFNDGACDSQGRFFAGTICSEKIPGRLYRLSSTGGEAELVDSGFTVSFEGVIHFTRIDVFRTGLQWLWLERRWDNVVRSKNFQANVLTK